MRRPRIYDARPLGDQPGLRTLASSRRFCYLFSSICPGARQSTTDTEHMLGR